MPSQNPHTPSPKIALVCDWLTTPGGAEKVLLELHHMYPDAPIYTSQYSKKGINWFDDATVKTGWLQIFPRGLRKFLGPLRQLYFSHLDLSIYDIVISVTGAEAKSIKTKTSHGSSYHLCYCHVPTQYYWQMYDKYVADPGFGLLNPLVRACFQLLVKPLRQADYRAAQHPDQFVTISTYAQQQIKQYYHRESVIVSPNVDVAKFRPQDFEATDFHQEPPSDALFTPGNYYIISCRQVTWKRVDLAIAACQELKVPLLVVGDGSEHQHLLKLAAGSPYIKFLPWTPSDQLATYLQHAKAYLFPSLEPFGIAAVEALAAGCPVIAYAEGGSRDIVRPQINGLLFDEQTPASLAQAIREFQDLHFDRTAVSRSADRFDTQHFRQGIERLVARASSSPQPSSPIVKATSQPPSQVLKSSPPNSKSKTHPSHQSNRKGSQ